MCTYTSALRMEILSSAKLTVADFDSKERALQAADHMVAALHAQFPGLNQAKPDLIVPGFPELDQFYYFIHQGAQAAWTFHVD